MNSILCRLLALCVLWCLSLSTGQAQIVSNPYFHNLNPASPLTTCATANVTVATPTNLLQDMCYAWGTPTNGTPDFYYGCDNLPATPANTDYGVPINIHFDGPLEDFAHPSAISWREVQAYAGIELIETGSSTYREYITQELNEPLAPGIYTISIRVRASNQTGNYLIKQLGCLFTTFRPGPGNTSNLNNGSINPAIGNYVALNHTTGFPSNQWYTTTAQIVITGATKTYLTIGNFQTNIADADWVAQHPEDDPVDTDQGYAYYFIDDVEVCEPCALDIEVTKLESDNPARCCHLISVKSEARSCNTFSSIRIRSAATGEILFTQQPDYSWSSDDFGVCFDSFESKVVLIELLDPTGQVLCSKTKTLICECRCEDLTNPSGVTIKVNRLATNSCCWNVELTNNENGCKLVTKGIVLNVPPPAYAVAFPGYELVTENGVTYVRKTTPGDDEYEPGTSSLLATICIPRGSFSYPVHFDVLKEFDSNGEPVYCGTGYSANLVCVDACCDLVLSAIPRFVATSGNPVHCCYAIDVQLLSNYSSCLRTVTLQTFNGTAWVDGSTTVIGSSSFSITHCVLLQTSQQIRLVFKDANGAAVCVKSFTLSCSCCNAITLGATRTTQNPCCFRVNGYISGCLISNYIIEQYQPMTGTWSPITAGVPALGGYYEATVCVYSGTSATIRIHFRDGNTIICTRELVLNCSSGGVGKMGVGNPTYNLQQKVYAVPNPAIDETTVHYTLRETSDVRLSLYNMLGEMMIEIQASQVPAGDQTTIIPTNELASGMYFMQVQAGSGVVTIPITIVK